MLAGLWLTASAADAAAAFRHEMMMALCRRYFWPPAGASRRSPLGTVPRQAGHDHSAVATVRTARRFLRLLHRERRQHRPVIGRHHAVGVARVVDLRRLDRQFAAPFE